MVGEVCKTAQDVGMVWACRGVVSCLVWFHLYMCLFSVRKLFCALFFIHPDLVTVQVAIAYCIKRTGGFGKSM